MPAGIPQTDEDQIATGVLIGSGIGGLQGIEEAAITLRDRGPRRISPFFIPGRLINLASGQVSIRHRPEGPEPFGGDRLLDRRARDRRRQPADRARRRRRDGRRRHRIAGLPPGDRRLRRLQGAVDAFQRPPDGGLAPLRPRPRRLRHGRGRRRRRARGARARAGARRPDLRRGDRLRPVRRRLPHHRAGRGRRRRRALHAHGAEARRHRPGDIDYINAHGTSTQSATRSS